MIESQGQEDYNKKGLRAPPLKVLEHNLESTRDWYSSETKGDKEHCGGPCKEIRGTWAEKTLIYLSRAAPRMFHIKWSRYAVQ